MNFTPYQDTLKDLAIKAIGEVPYAITELMSRSKLNWRWRIYPEQAECIRFADALRIATKEGRLDAVWTHVANESKRSKIVGMILKAMGMIPGSPDFWFVGKTNSCLIEFKRPDESCPKDFKDNQKLFAIWAQSLGIPVYLHNKAEDALASLTRHGLLR